VDIQHGKRSAATISMTLEDRILDSIHERTVTAMLVKGRMSNVGFRTIPWTYGPLTKSLGQLSEQEV
jgi:hypothetical protein